MPHSVRRTVAVATWLGLFGLVLGCGDDSEVTRAPCHPLTARARVSVASQVCPSAQYSVIPSSVFVGSSVVVDAAGDTDPDTRPSYRWASESGTFADPLAARTTFQCVEVGTAFLSLTVATASCETKAVVPVECTPKLCVGDGGEEAGCDDG